MDTCATCATLAARLDAAKLHYRARGTEIAQLHTRLARYASIGLRRFREGYADRERLVGTDVVYQNTILRRALAERDHTIQHQAALIKGLHALLQNAPREEVRP